jgi:hypothetical protein
MIGRGTTVAVLGVTAALGAALLLAAGPARAETAANLTGILLERGTRAPLVGVLVTVFRQGPTAPEGFEATSDADGRFAFHALAPGPWKIFIEAPGYYPYRTVEEIRAAEITRVTYFVERGSYNPFDVMVTAPEARKEVNRIALSSELIARVPGAAGDPLAVVQNLPGVARSFAPAGPMGSQIIVRGSAPEDSKVLVDGIEVPVMYHFGALRSVIPVGMLQGIDFLPGNFGSEYGRSTGGIVDARLKTPRPQRVGGYADVSILDASLYLEVPLGPKGSLALGGRRSYLDFLLDAAVPDSAPIDLVTAPVYYDYQLLASYRPTPAHELRLFLFGSDDRLELLFKNPADLDPDLAGNSFQNHTRFYRAQVLHRFVPGAGLQNRLRLAYGREQVFLGAGNLVMDTSTHNAQLRDEVQWQARPWLAIGAGLDLLFQQTDGRLRLPRLPREGNPDSDGPPDFSQVVDSRLDGRRGAPLGAFTTVDLEPGGGLLVTAGLRADRWSRLGQTTFDPRLSLRYRPPGALTLKAAVGRYSQEPELDESDPAFGNPGLGAERARHYSVGAEWRPWSFLTVDGTLFYKHLYQLVSPTSALRTEGGAAVPLVYDNGGRGRVTGLELLVRHDFSRGFMGWVAYTLSRAERRDSGSPSFRLFDFDQPHILTAVASYQLPSNWEISSRFRLASGSPRTPVTGRIYDAARDDYQPLYGPVNSARNGTFHQLDLRLDKRWVYQRWMLNLYLDLQNVYSRRNPEEVDYSYDYSQAATSRGLPVLGIFGIKAEL